MRTASTRRARRSRRATRRSSRCDFCEYSYRCQADDRALCIRAAPRTPPLPACGERSAPKAPGEGDSPCTEFWEDPPPPPPPPPPGGGEGGQGGGPSTTNVFPTVAVAPPQDN